MLRLKEGVTLTGIRPELLIGMIVAEGVYRYYSYELVVTCVTDGKHSRQSLHYSGCAVDLRTWDIPKAVCTSIVDKLNFCLGQDYDVILELQDGGNPSHIHIEYQPKTPAHLLD